MPTTDHMNVREILDAYKSESIDLEIAESKIRKSFYSDLGHITSNVASITFPKV